MESSSLRRRNTMNIMDFNTGGNAAFHNFHRDYSHIQDPSLRRRLILSEIDKVPFGWFHVRAVCVAGIGFFLDSYDIFVISLITQMLGQAFWNRDSKDVGNGYGTIANGGLMPISVQTAVKAATSGGAVLGMISFGYLADRLGRRKMYGIELGIIVFATFAQALASPSPAVSMTGLLVFWRVIMGIGIGGDYPMSSVITSEFAPTRWRGAMMAAVFSTQGAGQFVAALVSLLTTIGFKKEFSTAAKSSECLGDCQIASDKAWRIIVGVGTLPAVFALYYRITIPETPRYTFDVAHDIEKASADATVYMAGESGEGHPDPIKQAQAKKSGPPSINTPHASWSEFFTYFGKWKNGKALLGTTSSWFFLDFAYYGLGLNNGIILEAIGYSAGSNVYETLYNTAVGNLILVAAGAIPGYWLSIAFVDSIGRKPIQIGGFAILTIIFCIIGFGYSHLSKGAFLTLYILAQVFFNFGPNTTTFIVPGECFPTRYRATAHGLSAAAGKLGSIVSLVISQPLLDIGARSQSFCGGTGDSDCNPWLNHLMQIFALFMFMGTLTSFLIPETKGKTLEELAGEAGGAEADRLSGGNDNNSTPGSGGLIGILATKLGFGRETQNDRIREPGILTGTNGLARVETTEKRRRRRGEWLLGRGHGSRDETRNIRDNASIMSERDGNGGAREMEGSVDGKTQIPSQGWKYSGWNPDNIPLQDVGRLIG